MAAVESASEQITREVCTWPGVEAGLGRRGEYAFRLGRREIGHLHGDRSAHFFFPVTALGGAARAAPHRPPPGVPRQARPASRRIETDEDVADVIALLRLNYERAASRVAAVSGGDGPVAA